MSEEFDAAVPKIRIRGLKKRFGPNQVLDGLEPMGDLRRFVIEDLTPAEEDEFFRILEDA